MLRSKKVRHLTRSTLGTMAKSSLFNTRRSLALLFVSLFVASLAVLSRPFKHSLPLTAANGLNARSVLNLTENHGLHKRVTYAASIEKGRALNCKMSASIAHGIQLNGGTPLESAIEEEIFVSEPEFGWSMMDGKKPKYESTGLTNTDSTINADILKQLTGASPAGTVYNYIFNDNSVLLENGQEAHVRFLFFAIRTHRFPPPTHHADSVDQSQPKPITALASTEQGVSSLPTRTGARGIPPTTYQDSPFRRSRNGHRRRLDSGCFRFQQRMVTSRG